MGVYWAKNAAKKFKGRVEVVDLRTLNPLDEETIYNSVKKHSRCIVLTEEVLKNSFSEALAGRIQKQCFQYLDAPVESMGSATTPAIPLNSILEHTLLPNAEKVGEAIANLLAY